MATLAVRPRRFTADDRCLGGRYMLQQQFQALRRRVLNAATQMDTLQPSAAKLAHDMRRRDCIKLSRLRRRPYWRRVVEPALPARTQVDNTPPASYAAIADMAINRDLRERRKQRERRRPSGGRRPTCRAARRGPRSAGAASGARGRSARRRLRPAERSCGGAVRSATAPPPHCGYCSSGPV
eukprot:TRINITY_DN4917_c0_g2_i1.p3 TRINITY_DN4917_c0_g2~~TRINITY_DN4917_c0_g2_i1.p3  ORF type:complete len:212 (+),score=43.87 TRINITY_DN4917_c0_g2_i1:92-637(+)